VLARVVGPQQPGRARFAIADELTCYYDRPAEAANVHLEARVSGRLDQDALRAAVCAVLDAEPELLARQSATSRWQSGFYWEYRDAPDIDPVLTASFADEDELGRLRSEFLSHSPPLRVSPPLRFLIAAGPSGDALILNAHHARFDGLSCLRLLRQVADEYTALVGSPGPSGRDAAWTDERGAPATSEEGRRHLRRPDSGGSGGSPPRVNTARWLAQRFNTSKIARRPEQGPPGSRDGYGIRQLTWDGLAGAAWLRSAGISVNDLLIAALIITIGDWNAGHGRRPGVVRITMPVGDRAQAGSDGRWANTSRLTSVTARVVPGAVALDLLADVAAQTRYAKEHPGPQVDLFCRSLAAAPIPVVIKGRVLRTALGLGGSFLCDTCLVSNLGVIEPVRFGGAVASQHWFSTFAHMPRGLSLGALTTAGVLHLAFRYRRALLCDQAAADFAATYAETLRRLASREAGP
jgi:NRPS condensation-like uncharacterized protein